MTRYVSLAEYLWLAEQVTGVEAGTLAKGGSRRSRRLGSARAAGRLRRPGLLSRPHRQGSGLTCRLAWNHPLPDGNRQSAWASLVLFLDLNGRRWEPDPPDVDEAEAAMLAVAAGEVDEAWFADWLRARTIGD